MLSVEAWGIKKRVEKVKENVRLLICKYGFTVCSFHEVLVTYILSPLPLSLLALLIYFICFTSKYTFTEVSTLFQKGLTIRNVSRNYLPSVKTTSCQSIEFCIVWCISSESLMHQTICCCWCCTLLSLFISGESHQYFQLVLLFSQRCFLSTTRFTLFLPLNVRSFVFCRFSCWLARPIGA